MFPAIAGAALIGAASDLIGGHLNREAQEDANLANANLQRELAQSGITWRVQDAKRAGLHPLFALGAAGAQASPSFQVMADDSFSRAGQNLSRAATAFSADERELVAARLEGIKAQTFKDFAIGSAAAAEAAKLRQSANPPVAEAFPLDLPGQGVSELSIDGGPYRRLNEFELSPYQALPGYLTPDIQAGFTRYQVPGGQVMLPSPKMAEALESLENTILQALVVGANVSHYRQSHLRAVIRSRLWADPVGALRDGVAGYLDKHRR